MKKKTIKKLAKTNDFNYNITKAVEELSELQTVLLQFINKPEKVDKQDIIDEIGDVDIRLNILKELFPKDKIKERISLKLNKFEQYFIENKYKNKI